MKRIILFSFIATSLLISSCGDTTSIGSSISISITTPSATTNVSITSSMVVAVSDPNAVGITTPSSWSSVFSLKAVGSTTNLCSDSLIIYNSAAKTITCTPNAMADMTQYSLSISGLTDASGNRIDPASMAFQTGQI